MQMQLEEQGRPSDEIDNTRKQFTEQIIKSASKPEKQQRQQQDNQVLRQQKRTYNVPKGDYKLQGVEPKKDPIDGTMVKQLQNESLPFVVKKIKKVPDEDANYYLFGTKCILVT